MPHPQSPRALPRFVSCVLLSASLVTPPAVAANGNPDPPGDMVVILDVSGSMWGEVGGVDKIEIARRALGELIAKLPEASQVGLVAYGHRSASDCKDVETVVPIGTLDRASFAARVNALAPKGKTPITQAIEHTVAEVRKRSRPATIVLLSDGLETCGADPCAAVTAARKTTSFLLHVIGFDIGKENVASLECVAQAGGGLYYDASDATELAKALEQTVEPPAPVPAGGLVITTLADGALADMTIEIRRAGSSDVVARGRTYRRPETNPRTFPLADGSYDVDIAPVGLRAHPAQQLTGLIIANGAKVERTVSVDTGELIVAVTRNGQLSDATISVKEQGAAKAVETGRSYTDAKSNPRRFRLPPGSYDLEVLALELENRPTYPLDTAVVTPGGQVERSLALTSGTLEVLTLRDGQLTDSVVEVFGVESGEKVAHGRTYTSATSNPKRFTLLPGRYRIEARELGGPKAQRTVELELTAGESHAADIDY